MAAKVWVLDSETKGTGAQMVPLENVLRDPAAEPRPGRPAEPRPRRPREPEPRPPWRFRVVDALSRETLVEDGGARATVEALRRVRSPLDVTILVWEPGVGDWRLLTHAEKELLWGFRRR